MQRQIPIIVRDGNRVGEETENGFHDIGGVRENVILSINIDAIQAP
eukprot:CAMPEP_0119551932 /NCGR_PEP_ID=MMETSP1352-20130426/5056_1 /TAXON_ID=265584 /ORGANISM="Stauroneis constricta, Strain CCMP1120" /LENGTH=45 /DNA_ID= /DNA_START= /DNA_END= /DNA_ORIENTATION=